MKTFKQFFFEAKQSESLAPIVTYSGRFNPAHINHADTYKHLCDKFGSDNVYIFTSNKIEEKSPFSFEEKKTVWTKMFGVNPSHIIQVEQPYLAVEALNQIDPSGKRPVIAAVGEKDIDRLDNFSDYKGNKVTGQTKLSGRNKGVKEGASLNAYYYISPLMTLEFGGELISGTTVRNVFGGSDIQQKKDLFKTLYGKFDKQMYQFIVGKIEGHKKLYNEMKRYDTLAKKLALKLRDLPKIKANKEQISTYREWIKYWKAMSKSPIQVDVKIPSGSAPKVRE